MTETSEGAPKACPVCGKKVPAFLKPEEAAERLAKHMRRHETKEPPAGEP